jgi:hypothetical protein
VVWVGNRRGTGEGEGWLCMCVCVCVCVCVICCCFGGKSRHVNADINASCAGKINQCCYNACINSPITTKIARGRDEEGIGFRIQSCITSTEEYINYVSSHLNSQSINCRLSKH